MDQLRTSTSSLACEFWLDLDSGMHWKRQESRRESGVFIISARPWFGSSCVSLSKVTSPVQPPSATPRTPASSQ